MARPGSWGPVSRGGRGPRGTAASRRRFGQSGRQAEWISAIRRSASRIAATSAAQKQHDRQLPHRSHTGSPVRSVTAGAGTAGGTAGRAGGTGGTGGIGPVASEPGAPGSSGHRESRR